MKQTYFCTIIENEMKETMMKCQNIMTTFLIPKYLTPITLKYKKNIKANEL